MPPLVLDGTAPTLVTGHPEPTPAAGEALVRTVRAAVGRLDCEVCRGLLGFRGVLGREFVGVVEHVEGGRGAPAVGTRVVGSTSVACGACDLCQAGLSAHCRERTILGMQGRDGCLADRFVIPAMNLVPVPDAVDDDHAVFAQPLAAALQAERQLTIEGKPYITVLGDGLVGLLTVQVMARLNASVRLVGRHAERLAVCEKWGVKHRHVDDVGRRADQDIVVDCTGTPGGLALAMALVRPRGKVVVKSLRAAAADAAGADLAPLVLGEIELIGSHQGPVGEAVAQLARGDIDVVSLLGRRMSLDDGPALIEAAARGDVLRVGVGV